MKNIYTVIFERCSSNFSGYAPDVPGCISVGDTLEEMQSNMKEALEFHFEGLLLDGEPIPEPSMSIEDAMADYLKEEDGGLQDAYDWSPLLQLVVDLVEVAIPSAENIEAMRRRESPRPVAAHS